jgi:putative transposase
VPAKNSVKSYGENCFYHAFNRGYNKQEIFRDNQDYKAFLYLIRKYLEPGFREKRFTPAGEEYLVEPNHVYNEVDLVSFVLMPNHFHFQLFQKSLKGMAKLLVRLCSNYSTYFNKKYQLQGSPLQGVYKAVRVESPEQHLHLSRYIHTNPSGLSGVKVLGNYEYSSYPYYLSTRFPSWLKGNYILNDFKKSGSYRGFVEDYLKADEERKSKDTEIISNFLIET